MINRKTRKKITLAALLLTLSLTYILCIAVPLNAFAADSSLAVTTDISADVLAETLAGEGVTVTNAQLNPACSTSAVGTFTGGTDVVGFDAGIILSTGDANFVVGENISNSTTAENNGGNDSDLDSLGVGTSNDTCYLTFDVVSDGGAISFQYVLSSDEYEEYIDYPDIFGLFYAEVDDEGNIIGDYQNMAWIPGTSDPVSIGTINQNENTEYYISNCGDALGTVPFAMDGLTRVMNVSQELTSGVTYRIKLAIGDISDTSVDSNVFIKAGSVSGTTAQTGELNPGGKNEDDPDTIEVTIYRTNGSDGSVSADWEALDEGGNIVATGTVIFGDGETEKIITVPKTTVTVRLINPSGGVTIGSEETPLADLPQVASKDDATLTDLTVSEGTLAPIFDKETTEYVVEVANAIESMTVTPTATSSKATITVNGQSVNSGSTSQPIALNVGENTVTVEVTAEDGTTVISYTILVTRAAKDTDDNEQVAEGTVDINGIIIDDNGQPIPNLTVELHSDVQVVVTNENGEFKFKDVSLSTHELIIKDSDGNILKTFSLVIHTGDDFNWDKTNDVTIDISKSINVVALEITIKIGEGEDISIVNITSIENPNTGDAYDQILFALCILLISSVSSLSIINKIKSLYHK